MDEVESVYEHLDECLGEASRRRLHCVVAGDFNSQVGRRQEFDNLGIIGPHGYRERTARGERLVQWSTLRDLRLCNTFFGTADGNWTYRNGHLQSQLDYVLVGSGLLSFVFHCAVDEDIDTGSDHRGLFLLLRFPISTRAVQYDRQLCRKEWRINETAYKEKLDSIVAGKLDASAGVDARQDFLQKALREAADVAAQSHTVVEEESVPETGRLRGLISERRCLSRRGDMTGGEKAERRKVICKEVQKLARFAARNRKEKKIQSILSEFRGLKYIQAIKEAKSTNGIEAIKDNGGNEKICKMEIADAFADFIQEPMLRRKHQSVFTYGSTCGGSFDGRTA